MKPLLAILWLGLVPFTLAQVERVSPWTALDQSGFIASLQEAPDPETIDGFDLTKDYFVDFLNPDGSVVPMRVWLARDEGQAHAPFLSVGYYGPAEGSGGQAYGHLFTFLAGLCLGLDEATHADLTAAIGAFFPKLREGWQSETVNVGDFYLTMGGETQGSDVNMLLDLENIGAPGENGWFLACGLE